MKTIALCYFVDRPWEKVLLSALKKALSYNFKLTVYFGYPENDHIFDYLLLVGVRPVRKLKLDRDRLLKFSKFIIDFGDSPNDTRSNIESRYYFFNDGEGILNHYKKLPKFILDEYLYPEQDDNLFTIFVDHYVDNNSYHELVVRELNKCPFDKRIFYQSKSGIIENPSFDILNSTYDQRNNDFKVIPFEEIAAFYRKTHLFMSTHFESMGRLPIEIGACGGFTLTKKGTFPISTSKLFMHGFYDEFNSVNWMKVRDYCIKNKSQIRNYALKNTNFENFKQAIVSDMLKLQ